MGLHKITAGSGYDYLTRQVAALDATEKGHTSLASYYAEKGETPGEWIGTGMVGIDGLDAGDPVTAEQMQALFGSGHHPLAQQRLAAMSGPGFTDQDRRHAVRLGAPFRVYAEDASPFTVEVARRLATLNTAAGRPSRAALPVDVRAQIRSQVAREYFRAAYGRDPQDDRELFGLIARLSRPRTTAVAGFDLTFSPVKSVSTLWALADPATAAVIERAHRAAIADALRFLETRALFTRTGTNGVRQVDVRGLVGTAFTHRDSRAGDPDLHTHVAVANKVQTLDGRWLAIDGRLLYKAKVTASETYNTALERHLADSLGVQFSARTPEAGKRPVREIVGVDARLLRRWSARRVTIRQRTDQLAGQFQHRHGRPPTPVEALVLAQQATLETRQAKHEPRTLAEQRATWQQQAADTLGGQQAVQAMIRSALNAAAGPPVVLDQAWFDATTAAIARAVEADRATWQVWHVRAEGLRAARTACIPTPLVDRVVNDLVAGVLTTHSIPITPATDGITEPPILRRADGASVYEVAGAVRYTSQRILAAEHHLLDAAAQTDGRVVSESAIDLALLESVANGVTLNAGQIALVRGMATSGRRVQLAIAPAGSGKTTAMRALATAWSEDGGTVIGLAPSAAAAAQLGDQIGSHTDTLAKLTWSLTHGPLPDWADQIDHRSLVVIDEAGMADTLTLDAVVHFVLGRGGSVRLIGDDQQLAAIGAGGVLRDIHTHYGALRLTELVRFADPAEANASLALRDGQPEALGFYLDQHRLHIGDLTTLTEQLFTAWADDRAHGRDAIMLAPTRDLVADLNQRARTHRLTNQPRGLEADLADGNRASQGDTVITRSNDRRLRTSATDWVKNGDRWTVLAVARTGALRVQHTHTRRIITLPADYVASAVELGYATTIHSAQGVTADTCHGLAVGTETRQQLYTMLTRGRNANHCYLQVVGDGDPHSAIHPETLQAPTATHTLERILARDDTPVSATTHQQQAADPGLLLGHAVARYTDAVGYAAEHTTPAGHLAALDTHAEQLVPGITDAAAWPPLRAHLLLMGADGTHPIQALDAAVQQADLAGTVDPAAVVDWRLTPRGLPTRQPGPLPWLPGIPTRLADHPTWGPYLAARHTLVTTLTDQVHQQALTNLTTQPWHAPGNPPPVEVAAQVQIWRAAMAVEPADQRPTGERQLQKAAARWQHQLTRQLRDHQHPAVREWAPLLTSLDPALTRDPYTPTLARHLADAARIGINARALLDAALQHGQLPDDHAAAALWWRISRHLTPAVSPTSLDDTNQVTVEWLDRMVSYTGPARAASLQTSPWWPALVTVLDHAQQAGWQLEHLLRPTRPTSGLDDCHALVWRTSSLLHQPPEAPDADPADETPQDLWDGYTPNPDSPQTDNTPHTEAPASASQVGEPENLREPAQPDLRLEALIRAHLPAPEPTDADIRRLLARADAWAAAPITPDQALRVNALTLAFFEDRYRASWARGYLTERFGTDLAGNPDWRPGYAPAGWTTLVSHLRRHGISEEHMLLTGVATQASNGRLIDRFRDCAILPIVHETQILGFVGRRHPQLTDGDQAGPKYLNTADTPLFHKGAQLYTSPRHLRSHAIPVIVEGPMDAIAVTLAGSGDYVGVAPLGTALTDEQATQLRLLGRPVIIATDNDPAGQAAAERDYWILTPHHLHPQLAALPPGTDPADLLASGRELTLTTALDTAQPLAEHLLERHLCPRPASHALDAAVQIVAAQPPELWELGIHRIATSLGIPNEHVEDQLTHAVAAWNTDPRAAAARAQRDTSTPKTPAEGASRRRPAIPPPGSPEEPRPTSPNRAPSR